MAKSLSSQRLQSRILYRHSPRTVVRVLFVFLLLALGVTLLPQSRAQAAVSPYVNFQARLMTNGGGIVADGTYNIEFKLYNASSSSGSSQGSCTGDANCLWTETRVSGNQVTVRNGYVTVNLGSVTSLPAIDWSQQLWLTMRVGGTGSPSWDPEMSPRLQMTASPYAFSAGKLSTTNGSFLSTLSIAAPTGGSQTFTIPDQGAGGSYNLLTTASAATGFIQNGTSPQTANYNITGNGTIGGNLAVSGTYNGNTLSGSTLTFSTAATSNINAASGQGLNITGNGASIISTTASSLTLSAPATQSILIGTTNSNTITLGTTTATSTITVGRSTASNTISIGSGNTSTGNTQTISIGNGTPTGTGQATINIGNTANASVINLNAGTGNVNVAGSDLNVSTGIYRIGGAAGASTTCSGGQFLQNQVVAGGITTGGSCASASNGVTSVGAISGTSNANGATITGNVLNLTAADGTNGGVVTNTTQTFAGNKTFAGATTLTPTANSAVALTVNATSGTTAVGAIINQSQTADVLQLNSTTGGTQTNGMLYTHNGAGTTTNALNITNTTGTLTNGLSFSGTIGTDINRGSGTLTMNGGSGINLQTGGNTIASISSTGAIINGTLGINNSGPIYSWTTAGGTDLNWKTIANISLGTGTNVGATFTTEMRTADSSGIFTGFGMRFIGVITRSGAVQDDTVSATVRGPYSQYLRVVKVNNSTYELQVNQVTNGMNATFVNQFTSISGGTVSYVTSPANGTTTGTNYTATVSDINYFSHIRTQGNILTTNTSAIALSVADNGGNATLNVDTTTRTVFVDNIDAFATTGSAAPIARVSRVSASSTVNFGTGAYTPTTTFTPSAGTVLIANIVMEKDTFGTNMNTTGSDITISGGGLTWVPIVGRAATIGNTYDMAFRSFYAIVGSPASTQITTRANGNGTAFPSLRYHVMVDEYSGVDTTTPVAGAIASNRLSANNDTFTATLGATPATGDVKIGVSGMDEDNTPYGYSIPSGWTQLYNRTPSGGDGPESQVLSRTASTSTTLNWALSANLDLSPNTMTVYGGYIIKQSAAATTNAVLTLGSASTDIISNASRSFQVQNGAGGSLMYIDSASGRVGIGTNGPAYKLDVQDSQASNYVMRIQNTDTSTNADGLLIDLGIPGNRNTSNYYIGFSSGGSTVGGKIQGNGGINVNYATSGADYAEFFKAPPDDMPAKAELVQLNPNDKQAVLRSDNDPQKVITGIVSTSPGFTGNGPICNIDDDDCDTNYAKTNALVSLVGQVPLKVNSSHGPIKAGDPISVSDTPGVGAKATTAGYIVGTALESLDGDNGMVMTLVRPQYYTPSVDPTDQLTALEDQMNGLGTAINTGTMQTTTLKVTGNATIQGNLTVGGTVKAKTLELSGHFITHGETPTVELLAAAGVAGAGAEPQVTVDGNDISGLITVVTGTDASADAILRLTFNKPYGSTPRIALTPVGKASASLQPYVDSPTNANMAIGVIQVPQSGETYKFNYQIMQ